MTLRSQKKNCYSADKIQREANQQIVIRATINLTCNCVPFGAEVGLVGSGEMLFGLVLFADFAESSVFGGLLSVFALSFVSEEGFVGFDDLLGVAVFPSDPPKRSDSMSSKP